MHMTDLIEKKKQGQTLTQEELHFIVHGYTAGDIPDYQMSALMMAIYFRGMTPEETAQLTIEMEHSGDVVDLSPLGEHTADQAFDPGGVGDQDLARPVPDWWRRAAAKWRKCPAAVSGTPAARSTSSNPSLAFPPP